MPNIKLKVLHSAGCTEVITPDDIAIRELIAELLDALSLPSAGDHGEWPLEYRLDSKNLGRRLSEDETIADAQIDPDDTLILTVEVLAGSRQTENKSRISIIESSIGLPLDELEQIKVKHLLSNETALMMALHEYRRTLSQLYDCRQAMEKAEEGKQQLTERLRERNIATFLLILGQIQTGFGINLITSASTGGWLVFLCGFIWTIAALCFAIFGGRNRSA